MRLLNEQAQLFVVAAALFVLGFWLLYLALGLYTMVIEKVLVYLKIKGALIDFIISKSNKRKWWNRLYDGWDQIMRRGE